MSSSVTVLCAVYNAAPFLRASLDSVLAQSFRDFELLLVDDGSTDGSEAIVDEYAARDSRVVVARQRNIGLTRALNAGLAKARGEIVLRHDADDVSCPERLTRQVHFLERHPEHAVVGTEYRRVNAQGQSLGLGRVPRGSFAIKWNLLCHNVIAHPTAAFRRSRVLELGGYDERLSTAQDYDLWCRLALRFSLANLAYVGVLRREHDGRIGVTRLEDQLRSRDLIRERYRREVISGRLGGLSGALLRLRARSLAGAR